MSKADGGGSGPKGLDTRLVAWYVALVRSGAEVGVWRPRDLWELGVQGIGNATSSRSLRTYTRAAEKMGLIEVERGAGRKKGRVRLMPPGHPDQFIPCLVEAGLEGETLARVLGGEVEVEQALAVG